MVGSRKRLETKNGEIKVNLPYLPPVYPAFATSPPANLLIRIPTTLLKLL